MEENATGKYLERLQIEGLWGHYDVDWQLHPDVNILVGENGTGKSTVLRLAMSGLKFFILKKRIKFNHVTIRLDNKLYQWEKFRTIMDMNGEKGYSLNGEDGVQSAVKTYYLNTFESFSSEQDGIGSNGTKTNLDRQLDEITRHYLAYQAIQSSKVFSKQISFEKAFAQKSYLFDTLNRLFASTGKTVDEQNGELEFLLEGTERITRQDLSSGEKQLLIILLTVLCQEENPAILVMDEPEISLHLRWQYELVDIIRHLNPHCQVIIATHSPSIFNDGWRDKVFWMENLAKKIVPA